MGNERRGSGCVILLIFLIIVFNYKEEIFSNYTKSDISSSNLTTKKNKKMERESVDGYSFVVKYTYSNNGKNGKEFSIQNTSNRSADLKWILVNFREDCLIIPTISEDGSYELSIVDENFQGTPLDYIKFEVGSYLYMNLPKSCGEPVRLKVGTSEGNVDLGPIIF